MANSKVMGVDFPCYADFKCEYCSKSWSSCKAWKNHHQACSQCKRAVKAHLFELLYYYECTKCNITFKNKCVITGLPCQKCSTTIHPKTYSEIREKRQAWGGSSSLNPNHDPNDPKAGHKSSLCEKCKLQGGNCMERGNKR